ncbi:zf-HC2 domain-containing protein, partial [Streptomyces nigra]
MTGAEPYEPGDHERHDRHDRQDRHKEENGPADSARGTDGMNSGDGDHQHPTPEPGPGRPPRIPVPRASVEDTGRPLPDLPDAPVPALEHRVLKSLLGAWALAACSPEETAAVEEHLGDCGGCADEALRLREAVGLLHPA